MQYRINYKQVRGESGAIMVGIYALVDGCPMPCCRCHHLDSWQGGVLHVHERGGGARRNYGVVCPRIISLVLHNDRNHNHHQVKQSFIPTYYGDFLIKQVTHAEGDG